MSNTREFLLRFLKLAAQKGFALALGFLSLSLITRSLGAPEMGLYFAVVSAGGVLATPFNGAMSPFLINEIARHPIRRAGYTKGLAFVLSTAALIYAAFIYLIALLVLPGSSGSSTNDAEAWKLVPLIVISLSVTAILSSSLLANGRTSLSQVPDNLIRPSLFILLIALLNQFFDLSVRGVLAGLILAQLTGVLVILFAIASKREARSDGLMNPMRPGMFASYGRFLLNAGAVSVYTQAPTLIVASFALSEAAYFSLAQKMVGLLAVIGSLIGISNSKAFAEMAAQGETTAARLYFNKVFVGALAIIIPIAFVWLFFGKTIIGFAFGRQYASEVAVVVLTLLPAQIAFSLVGPVLTYLYGTRLQFRLFCIQGASIAVVCGLGIVLSRISGATGMAAAVSITQVLLYGCVYAMFRRATRQGSSHGRDDGNRPTA
jgi:O-antigen/teichoic acid export membrane protein